MLSCISSVVQNEASKSSHRPKKHLIIAYDAFSSEVASSINKYPGTMEVDGVYDCIVVGIGGHGSASLAYLAKSGQKVLGLEQFKPVHKHGQFPAVTLHITDHS